MNLEKDTEETPPTSEAPVPGKWIYALVCEEEHHFISEYTTADKWTTTSTNYPPNRRLCPTCGTEMQTIASARYVVPAPRSGPVWYKPWTWFNSLYRSTPYWQVGSVAVRPHFKGDTL